MAKHNKFKQDLLLLFYDRMLEDEVFCKRVYSSITNIKWYHDGEKVTISFRSAGGIIADILNDGCYLDWYCSAPEGVVDKDISDEMLKIGWVWENYDN